MMRHFYRITFVLFFALFFAGCIGGSTAWADTAGFWNFSSGGKDSLSGTVLTESASGVVSGGVLTNGYVYKNDGLSTLPTGTSSYTISSMMRTTTAGNLGIAGWGAFGNPHQTTAIRTINEPTVGDGNSFRHYWWVDDLDSLNNTAWGTSAISGRWNHVVATGTASLMSTYMNGQLLTSMVPPGTHDAKNVNLAIGATGLNYSEQMVGSLDNVGIYGNAMAHTDVINISAARYSGLITEWNAQDYTQNASWVDRIGGVSASIVKGTPVRSGNSVVFDGDDAFQVAAADNPLAGLTSFTILAAVTPNAAGTGGDADAWYGASGIVGGEMGGIVNDWGLGYNSTRKIVAGHGFFPGQVDTTLLSTGTIGQSVNAVAGYRLDGSSLSTYIDGVNSSSTTVGVSGRDASQFHIGRIGISDSGYFSGQISSIRIFDRALNSSEMQYYSGQMKSVHAYTTMTSANAGTVNPSSTGTLWAQTGAMDISGRSMTTPLGIYVGGFETAGTLTASFDQFNGAQMTLLLGGGTLNVTTGDGSYTKTLNVDGGRANVTGDLNLDGDSRFVLHEGTFMSSGALQLGNAAGSNVVGELNAGTLSATTLVVGGAGAATFTYRGGSFDSTTLSGARISIGQYGTFNMYKHPSSVSFTNNGTLNVYNALTTNNLEGTIASAMVYDKTGGGLVLWNNQNSNYAGGISTSGWMVKKGSGKLAISGSVAAGLVYVEEGTLQLSQLGNYAITDLTSFIFAPNSDATLSAANVISGAGNVTYTGGHTVTINSANSYEGGTTVMGGTSVVTSMLNGLGATGRALTLNSGSVDLSGVGSSKAYDYSVQFSGENNRFCVTSGGGYSTIASLSGTGSLTAEGWLKVGGTTNIQGTLVVGNGSSSTYVRLANNTTHTISRVEMKEYGRLNLEQTGVLQIGVLDGTSLYGDYGEGIFITGGGSTRLTLKVGYNTSSTDVGNYSGIIRSGSDSLRNLDLEKVGAGTQIFSRTGGYLASTAYTFGIGSVTVSEGVMEVNASGISIGTGYWHDVPITVNSGGTLRYSGLWNSPSAQNITVNGGTIELGTLNYLGQLTLNDGSRIQATSADVNSTALRVGFTCNPTWTTNGTVNVTKDIYMATDDPSTLQYRTYTLDVQTGTLTVEGIHDLAGYSGMGVVKRGGGMLVLNGASSYSGSTTLEAGTLKLGTDNAVSASSESPLTISGGIFDLNGHAQTLAGLSGTGGALNGSGTLTLNGSGVYDYSGSLVDIDLSIIKSGTGTQTIAGADLFNLQLTNGTLDTKTSLLKANTATLTGGTLLLGGPTPNGIVSLGGTTWTLNGPNGESDAALLYNTFPACVGVDVATVHFQSGKIEVFEFNLGGNLDRDATNDVVFNMSGGTLKVSAINIGKMGTDKTATLNHSAGTMISSVWLTISDNSVANGVAGRYVLTGTGAVDGHRLVIGNGDGIYTQNGVDTVATFSNGISVGGDYWNNKGLKGVLNLQAGSLSTPGTFAWGAGDGYVNQTGGTLTLGTLTLADATHLLDGQTYLMELNGANAVLNVDTLTNANTLLNLQQGTLNARNVTGTLSGRGAALNFIGTQGDVNGAVSGTLALENGSTATFTGTTEVSASITADDSSSVQIGTTDTAGDGTFSGTANSISDLTVKNGSLKLASTFAGDVTTLTVESGAVLNYETSAILTGDLVNNGSIFVKNDLAATLHNLSGTDAWATITKTAGTANTLTLASDTDGQYAGRVDIGSDTLLKTGTGKLVITGTVQAGKTVVQDGILQVGDNTAGTSGTVQGDVEIVSGRELEFSPGAGATQTYLGVLSGEGIVRKIGDGTSILGNAANTYTGSTIVEQGILQIGTASTPNWTLNTGSALQAIGGQMKLYINDTMTLPNTLTGSGTLVKAGEGALTLGETASGFTGDILVNQGKLTVSTNLASTNVTVDGCEFELIDGGSVANVTVDKGDFSLLGGSVTGELTMNSATGKSSILGGSVSAIVVNSGELEILGGDIASLELKSGRVDVTLAEPVIPESTVAVALTGSLDLYETVDLYITMEGADVPSMGDYFLFTADGGITQHGTNAFQSVHVSSAAGNFTYLGADINKYITVDTGTNKVVLHFDASSVPEPSTWLLLLLGGLGMFVRSWRVSVTARRHG